MYKLVIFDMDGVLLDSERLKALSYAEAINFLSEGDYAVIDVCSHFSNVVGSSREVVVDYLLSKFPLNKRQVASVLASCDDIFPDSINSIVSETRMAIYRKMLKTPSIVNAAKHEGIINLLYWLKGQGMSTGVATMSAKLEAKELLDSLGLLEEFDFILTRESVKHPKPDPEIYLKASEMFNIKEVLVIEDSLTGITAALAAELDVAVLLTDITRERVVNSEVVRDELLFYNQVDLVEYVKSCITN